VNSIAFSPDGKRIASGSDDHTIRVWDADSGELIAGPSVGHTHGVSSVAFSPDGKRIASASFDCTIRVWDADLGELVAGPFDGRTHVVKSVAFSLDGKRIASGSNDHTIRVWDADSGELVTGSLHGHMEFFALPLDGKGHSADCMALTRYPTIGLHPSPSRKVSAQPPDQVLLPQFCPPQANPGTLSGGRVAHVSMEHGWVLGPQSQLLFWVPQQHRGGLWWPGTRQIMSSRRVTALGLDSFVHGPDWWQCKG